MTEPQGRAWAQTTYYPFLYTSQRGRGAALRAQLDVPAYSCRAGEDIPFIDCAAVLSEGRNEIALFLINKNLENDISCQLSLSGTSHANAIEWISLYGYSPDTVNTADHAPVQPVQCGNIVCTEKTASFTLPKASWNMVRLELKI
jgi:alpha-N-arabinofuranosidase